MMMKLAKLLSVINLVIVGYFAYLAFWPFHIIDITPQPYEVVDQIESGSYLTYEFNYCKYYNVPAHIIYELVRDEFSVALPLVPPQEIDDYTLRLEDSCDDATKAVYIPTHTPAGKYKLVEYVDYHVTPFQTVSYKFETEFFEVVKK